MIVAPEETVTEPLMVNGPEMTSVLVDEKEGVDVPLMVKAVVLVVVPVPPTIELGPETVTPAVSVCVPLLK